MRRSSGGHRMRPDGRDEARREYREELERYGLWMDMEEELMEEEARMDRLREKGGLRTWEL
jgi:hypothetical protein